ncbi:hypothetical protein AVO45_09405 [Ruegeria marisrubri]|uniref:MmeI-like N-terminal domain-containing protein n=1 Tax=Ruegeria marisrubri TaxID=1685379 RepID=A0A0X3TQY8_9RHOB|nr:type IIL restriction-modification enzyme MmeI [Ruegeria marisrubri]KUJ78158.1 hypothetical protein AVO45_09405 [Ruegeria marisrubri]
MSSAAIGESSKKFIDFYRRGSFILETKQGSQAQASDPDQLSLPTIPKVKRVGHGVRGSRTWDKAMVKARGRADNYARGIAREDGWPPFIIVCDVGYVFEIYAGFSGQGHGYTQFPDGNSFRIFLDDLAKLKSKTCSEPSGTIHSPWTHPKRPQRSRAKLLTNWRGLAGLSRLRATNRAKWQHS